MINNMLSHAGITQPITEWALDYGIYPAVIIERLASGWTADRAITTPMLVHKAQRLSAEHLPGLPTLPRSRASSSNARTSWGSRHTHNGMHLSIPDWSERMGIPACTLRARLRAGLTMSEAIGYGRRPARRPGVVKNLPVPEGTGGGSVAQDIA